METATAKVGARKDPHTLINDKLIELLDKGIVPWRKPWTAGIPRNLVSGNQYRNINLLLLSCLGYESNYFITEKQLKEIGGAILAGERPHIVAHLNYTEEAEAGRKQAPKLSYYLVYNTNQCSGIPTNHLATAPVLDIEACQRILADMPHCPEIKSKDATAYYEVLEDYVNMPKPKAFKGLKEQYSVLIHQLIHSTGHHTRLDRMGLVQMNEYGYSGISQEEVVADMGGRYLEALTGIVTKGEWDDDYLQACKAKLKHDKNFIFTAAILAQKAIDFILYVEAEVVEETEQAIIE